MNSKFEKVLIIGIDGMEPKIVEKLFKEDKLPNFNKLSETGSFLRLSTSFPPHSPVAWTSISTGTNPGKHNIFDFIRRNPETYMPELSLSKTVSGIAGTNHESYVKAEPFWRILTSSKIPVTTIRWPMTFPPERIEGNSLAGLGVPDIKGFLSGYTFYTEETLGKKDDKTKSVCVTNNNGLIETKIKGPKIRKSGDIVDITTPVKIELSDSSAKITIDKNTYEFEKNSWSNWIRIKFKVGMLNNVYGTFKAYLVGTAPFSMYLTTIQIDPENPITNISYPDKYSEKLAEKIGLYYTLGIPEETDGYVDGKIDKEAFIKHTYEIEAERDKMFWKEFSEFKKQKKGVFGFVYDTSDRVQHVFWDDKILSDNNSYDINQVIVDYYVKKDAFVGEVINQIDENTLILIISDHGFTSFERSMSLNTWLVNNGYMTLTKKLEEDEEGALFQYVDWKNTQAYAVGFNSLYFNIKGREGKGIVDNQKIIAKEIISKLENIKDKKTGNKVINKVHRREEIHNGDCLEDAPDLIIGFNPGYRMAWQTAIGGFTKDVLMDNTKKWKGDHLVDPKFVPGVLFSNIKFNKKEASQMDIAPTIIDAVGLETPNNMDGESLLK